MKKTTVTLVTIVCTLLLVSISCVKKVGKLPPEETTSGSTTSTTSAATTPSVNCDTITYTKHIKPIIDGNCISCHQTGLENGFTNLESYTLVKAKAQEGRIKARVIDGEPSYMPQDKGKLPKAQLDLISCWLNNGMKE